MVAGYKRAADQPAADSPWTAPRPSQQERYEKVLQATIDLAHEGGYDAVQMRAVAERSGVALGTVYTYFQSRDLLLYRATVAWNISIAEQAAKRAAAADHTGIDGLEDHFIEVIDLFLDDPGLLDAYVRATLSSDPVVAAERRNVTWEWWTDISPSPSALGPEIAEIAATLLTDVFYSGTVRWAFGQVELAEIREQLRATIRLLIRASRA
ncbi:TetR/AcrR family transcriptional regulator [Rhodococcus koreensis]|uniref:DNA-binding transcriptional regulator, AcrR family n=1 Tax=Rhodococcus koreensis TaxID=99653 RepID=A0A1H4L174_9NOCA|nr:TetR/AcrR family transcriptional regulator [Rhodococcus koreensis]SEB64539.1 DNA-binding transcriptional regulator, AcrR family [Rhodococcus koreensis]